MTLLPSNAGQSTSMDFAKVPEILIVDDTLPILKQLSDLLRARGYEPRPVSCGAVALELAIKSPPDLVLLDVDMPQMDGFEVCEAFKANPVLKDIPIIFLSGASATSDKMKAFQAGGADYVTKPFQFLEVEARVRTQLENRALRLNLESQVEMRTRQLKQAMQRLAVLDKAKNDFLAVISHELRTPLNGLFGITDLLMGECASNSTTENLRTLFNHSRRRILDLIGDALLLTQIEVQSDRFIQMPTALKSALGDAVVKCREFGKTYCVGINVAFCADRCMVAAESILLRKALEALLETAIKFAKAHSVVRVSISSSDEPPEVRVGIEAFGRAIPQDALPRFFDVLAIAEAMVPGGEVDLRPAAAERIIRLFDGSVTVENLDPAGIRFNIRLTRVQVNPPEVLGLAP